MRYRVVGGATQARVHALVDFLADPLDEALGYGRVVARAKLGVSRH